MKRSGLWISTGRIFLCLCFEQCAVEGGKTCAQQASADDVTDPVDTGEDPPHHQQSGEPPDRPGSEAKESPVADAAAQLHPGRGQDAHGQQGGGGGVGGLQPSLDQHRAVVDGEKLEKQEAAHDHPVKSAQEQQISIDFPKLLPPDPLGKAQKAEGPTDTDGHQPQPVRQGVQGKMDTRPIMEGPIEKGQAHTAAHGPDGPDIQKAHPGGPNAEGQKQRRGKAEGIFLLFHRCYHPY